MLQAESRVPQFLPVLVQGQLDAGFAQEGVAVHPGVAVGGEGAAGCAGAESAIQPEGCGRVVHVEVREVVVGRAGVGDASADKPVRILVDGLANLAEPDQALVALAADFPGQPHSLPAENHVVVPFEAQLQGAPTNGGRLQCGQAAGRLLRPYRVGPVAHDPFQGDPRRCQVPAVAVGESRVVGGHRFHGVRLERARPLQGLGGPVSLRSLQGDQSLVQRQLSSRIAGGGSSPIEGLSRAVRVTGMELRDAQVQVQARSGRVDLPRLLQCAPGFQVVLLADLAAPEPVQHFSVSRAGCGRLKQGNRRVAASLSCQANRQLRVGCRCRVGQQSERQHQSPPGGARARASLLTVAAHWISLIESRVVGAAQGAGRC